MRRLGMLLAPVVFTTMAGVAAAAEPPSSASKNGIKPDLIYHNYCSVCHGDRGDGRSRARASLVPPPKSFTAPGAREQLPRDWMIAVVRDGKPRTAMVGWKTQLNEREIEAVVDYIRTTFMQAEAPVFAGVPSVSGTSAHGGRQRDAGADMTLPAPGGRRGDAARGAKFYAANCATCHGANGDGQGPRAYFIVPRPRSFVDPAARAVYNRPALFAAISAGKRGTEMPAWRTVIDEQQIADVAEYVFVRFIRAGNEAPARAKK